MWNQAPPQKIERTLACFVVLADDLGDVRRWYRPRARRAGVREAGGMM
jgi:hypothetical protein